MNTKQMQAKHNVNDLELQGSHDLEPQQHAEPPIIGLIAASEAFMECDARA